MQFIQDGKLTVTSPVYAGTEDQVKDAVLCGAHSWEVRSDEVEGGRRIIVEHCLKCKVAMRLKYSTP